MKKKVLSAVLALALVFGSAAALPQGFITESSGISVSAASELVSGSYKYKVLGDNTVQITGYTGKAASVTIPSTIGGKTVTSIGYSAFSMNSTLTSVAFPDTLKEIGSVAFLGCAKLQAVSFGKGLQKIGSSAFAQNKLTSVTIPANVTQIGEKAFESCTSLKSVTIKSGETATVDNYAFRGCSALTTVDFGKTVSAIGTSAFEGCKALTKVTIPASVKSISQAAFKDCIKLTTANLGNGVEIIAANAFINCSSLKNVKFGTSLKSIGDSAFEKCTSLPSITLMPSTTEIGTSAFAGCDALKYATLSGAEVIGNKAFSYCPKLCEVVFCDNVRAIGIDAFINCESLLIVGIPDSATEIREHAFGFGYDSKQDKYGKLKDFTIVCYDSSDAMKYATDNGFKYYNGHTESCINVTVPATCTTEGYTLSICTGCGNTKKSNITAKNGHPSGTYYRTTAFDTKAKTSTQTGVCTVCGGAVRKTTKNAISRLAGDNRYTTAVDISKAEYNTASTVILANSMNYADALAGVPLATKLGAPILLTGKDSLDKNTAAEIKRLGAKNVIILGGEGAVSEKVVRELEGKDIKTERIGGATRFETATRIAQKLTGSKAPSEVFFVYGYDFADALSVGAVAAKKGAPIIYLTTKGNMNVDTSKYLRIIMGKVTTAYVIGGEGVISGDMIKKVGTHLMLTDSSVKRVAGANRYETCVKVNKKFSSTLSTSGICVAKGLDFPDALAGGVYAAKTSQPLFLADSTTLKDTQKSYLKAKNPAKITAFGGKAAVSDNLIGVIAKASI